MVIKTEMLRCFCTVAQSGNLSDAALRLGRTPSAISMTLKQLEAHLNQRLFESDRKNRLTQFGQQVFDLAQTELHKFDEMVGTIEALAKAPQGLTRIGAVPSVASLMFPRISQHMSEIIPGSKLELHDAASRQIIDALSRGHIDIGIASCPQDLNGVLKAELFSDRFGLICAPDHPLARQTQMPCLNDIAPEYLLRNELVGAIDADDIRSLMSGAAVSVRNTLSLLAMVSSGHWITILPQAVVKMSPQRLTFRNIRGLTAKRQVSVLMRERTPYPDHANTIWDFITATDWSKELE